MMKINYNQVRKISLKSIGTWYSSLVPAKENKPPYRHLVQIGDPILRSPAEKVAHELFKTPELKNFIKLMKYVLDKHNCVGISAPQIGIPLQILMIEFSKKHAKVYSEKEGHSRGVSLLPLTVAINPTMRVIDYTKVIFPESCGSVKGLWADVPRYLSVELDAFDENGTPFKLQKSGWTARIIQHEMDHLKGILYTDIMEKKTLTCSCWNVINERGGKVELPYGSS